MDCLAGNRPERDQSRLSWFVPAGRGVLCAPGDEKGGRAVVAPDSALRSAVNDLPMGAVIKLTWNQEAFREPEAIMLGVVENSHFSNSGAFRGGQDYPQNPGIPLWITLWVDAAGA